MEEIEGQTLFYAEILNIFHHEIQNAMDHMCAKIDTQTTMTQNACMDAFKAHAERIVNIETHVKKFMEETVQKIHDLELSFANLAMEKHENDDDESMGGEEGLVPDPAPPLPHPVMPNAMPWGPNGPHGAPVPPVLASAEQHGPPMAHPLTCPPSDYGQQGAVPTQDMVQNAAFCHHLLPFFLHRSDPESEGGRQQAPPGSNGKPANGERPPPT